MNKASQNTSDSYGLLIDKPVIVRTVTHTFTGNVTQVTDCDIVLHQAAWIAVSGRWNQAVKGVWESSAEIEMYPPDAPVILPRGAIVECTLLMGELPTETK